MPAACKADGSIAVNRGRISVTDGIGARSKCTAHHIRMRSPNPRIETNNSNNNCANMFPREIVDLRIQEVPRTITTKLSFHVYTREQLKMLIRELPEGTTPRQKGDVIPYARVQLEIGNTPVVLKIKQCTHPNCNRMFLSAGPRHRKCHHEHRNPVDKLY